MSEGPKEPAEFPEVTPGTDVDATDNAVENTVPDTAGGPEVVGVRHGMFGVRGSGDTSGYGGLVRPVTMPGDAARPYGGWFDEVADALEAVGAGGAVVGAGSSVGEEVGPTGPATAPTATTPT